METIIIQKAIIISLIVISFWCMFLEGMIFGKIRELEIPEWMKPPLYDCPVCMMPHYGSIFYWIFFPLNISEWILVILVAMGIATVFVKIKKN